MQRITGFFSGVALEMRKVSWPKRKELINYTTVVLATVVIMMIFFAGVDLALSELLRWILSF